VTPPDGEPVVPPTRVAESRTPESTPAPIARQRWPIMLSASAIVLALLVIGALFAFSDRPGRQSESSGAVPADQAAPAPTVGTPTIGTPSTSSGTSAVTPVATAAEPASGNRIDADPRATPSSSARSRSVGETPATTRSSPETVTGGDLSARIPVLLEQSRDDETTLSARREAANLLPLAHGAQVVALKLVQVRSYAMKNEDARACEILQAVQQQSRGTEYETEVIRLLESCPR